MRERESFFILYSASARDCYLSWKSNMNLKTSFILRAVRWILVYAINKYYRLFSFITGVYTPHFRSHCALCLYSKNRSLVWQYLSIKSRWNFLWTIPFRHQTIPNWEQARTRTGKNRKSTGWKTFFVDLIVGDKKQDAAYFSVRIHKKVLNKHVISIISPEVLFKNTDYAECLLHTLLNYLIFGVIFSKKNAIFFADWTYDSNRSDGTCLQFPSPFHHWITFDFCHKESVSCVITY
jgi:hypothetical protein